MSRGRECIKTCPCLIVFTISWFSFRQDIKSMKIGIPACILSFFCTQRTRMSTSFSFYKVKSSLRQTEQDLDKWLWQPTCVSLFPLLLALDEVGLAALSITFFFWSLVKQVGHQGMAHQSQPGHHGSLLQLTLAADTTIIPEVDCWAYSLLFYAVGVGITLGIYICAE